MADDQSYFISKITNERVSPATILSEELEALQKKVDSGESQITDMNVGSEVRNLLEAMANSQYQYRYNLDQFSMMVLIKYAKGGWLDDIAWQYGLTRKPGNNASGIVRFDLSVPLDDDYIIPQGVCILNRRTGLEYYLNETVRIPKGSTSTTGVVVAGGLGTEYNCEAGELTAFDTEQALRPDLSVINVHPIYNGKDLESDDEFRERILRHIRGGTFGSLGYYKSLCENVTNVHDVTFIAPEILNSNLQKPRHTIEINGKKTVCNDCTGVCIVNVDHKANDTAELATLNEIDNILTKTSNLIFGHEFHVRKAYGAPLYFKIDYYGDTTAGVSDKEVWKCLTAFFFGGTYDGDITITYTGCMIGETVYKEDIINALENIKGIHHVEQMFLLKWHEDVSGVAEVTKYFKEYYKGTKKEASYKYKSILDYPDSDDVYSAKLNTYEPEYNKNCPFWSKIAPADMNVNEGQSVYSLNIDGYYFYKVKDNNAPNDGNAGEYPLIDKKSSDDKNLWQWGRKTFNTITVYPDTIPYPKALNTRQKLDYDGHDYEAPNVWLRNIHIEKE